MRKIHSFTLLVVLLLVAFRPQSARAEIPAKARAFLTMTGYGTAGGALLGVATMAFGNSTRAVAQGASLGLYAGLLFGTYVLVSHHQKQMGSYDDNASPYQDSSDIYGDDYNSDDGGAVEESESSGGFFDRFQVMQEHMMNQSFTFDSQKRKSSLPPIHVNLLNLEF